jgi:beta-mannosidase
VGDFLILSFVFCISIFGNCYRVWGKEGKKLRKRRGNHLPYSPNTTILNHKLTPITGGPERLFVRKAQYHWGWDWGPAVNTSGPWKDIWLETYTARISEFLVRQQVSDDLSSATLKISGVVDGEGSKAVVISVADPSGKAVAEKELPVTDKGVFQGELTLDKDLQLWYPFLYGSSPLYSVSATLAGRDVQTRKMGLRRLRLLQHELKGAPGTSFVFEINNIRVFGGGSCWIPGDFMLPRMTRQRYEDWLMAAKGGNQSMVC